MKIKWEITKQKPGGGKGSDFCNGISRHNKARLCASNQQSTDSGKFGICQTSPSLKLLLLA